MTKYYAVPIVMFVASMVVLWVLQDYALLDKTVLFNTYSGKLQMPLFTGFFTVSGFLISLTIFIIVKMHESIYQKLDYQDQVAHYKEINPEYSYIRPLTNLTNFLLASVVAALCTSFSQLTLGNIPYYWITIFCISLGVSTFGFILTSCFLIRKNILFWFDFTKKNSSKKVLD